MEQTPLSEKKKKKMPNDWLLCDEDSKFFFETKDVTLAIQRLENELKIIINTLEAVGELDDYQRRMIVQVKIDIENQFKRIFGDFKLEEDLK